MNDRTREALEILLKNEKQAWDKDGKLRYGWILAQLRDAMEASFYDEWYWPTAQIVFGWIKRDLPMFEWEVLDVGYTRLIALDFCYSLELPDLFEQELEDVIAEAWGDWFSIPSEAEILALGIIPPLVWPKEYADGAVQASMF